MAVEPTIKRPLLSGQFAWAASKKDGKLSIRIGPDAFDVTDDEILMIPDPDNPEKLITVDHPSQAIQEFKILQPGQYAIIHNPNEKTGEENYPNGTYRTGKNDMPSLQYGAKRVITAGYFPIWPGQKVEIKEAHHLSASQYVMVVVESLPIDEKAPYYDLTVKCAQIRKAVVDETVAAGEEAGAQPGTAGESGDGKGAKDPKKGLKKGEEGAPPEDKTQKEEPAKPGKDGEPIFVVGQRIIIPGNMTPTYIPPSGIEVVPEEAAQTTTGDPVLGTTPASDYVKSYINRGRLDLGELQNFTRMTQLGSNVFSNVRSRYGDLRDTKSDDEALFGAIQREMPASAVTKLARYLVSGSPEPPRPAAEESQQVVREAVVPGPTQFCVLIDADGTPQTYKGPGRVFPGPYDRFRVEGSQNGKYDAYHIRPDRGILLRVVAETVEAKQLMKQIPGCTEAEGKKIFEKTVYTKGDEIFIGGFDAYLVPSNAIEVIDPETRKPHIGNDHSNVYVASIGVDQKSGVYVANVDTGNVKTVRGEKKLLNDPRKEKHLKRRVPGKLWNLMIGHSEPHKKVSESAMVETPWALSIVIPNNEAVLVTSKDGRHVVEGAKTELLEYEEVLEVLTLSTGQQKSDKMPLETCFLRVAGNRITDTVELETSDFVKVEVILSYGVRFVADNDEDKQKWFDYKDYVMLLCANLRSRLKGAAHGKTITDLYPVIPSFVRDTILGEKPEGAHRPGLKFEENNMLVEEVEVLSYRIPDTLVADAMEETNQTIVTRQIVDAQKKAELASDQLRAEIEESRAKLTIEAAERARLISVRQTEEQAASDRRRNELDHELALTKQGQAATLEAKRNEAADAAALAERTRKESDQRSQITLDDERRGKLIEFRTKFVTLQKDWIAAEAAADKTRLDAVQKGLVEALEGLGNKELAQSLAENLPKAGGTLGFLLGTGGMTMLKQMVKGTPFEKALNALEASGATLEAEAGKTE